MSTDPPGRDPLTRIRLYANGGAWRRALVTGISYGAFMSVVMTLFQHMQNVYGDRYPVDLPQVAAVNFVLFGAIWGLMDAKGLFGGYGRLHDLPPETARPAREAMILGRPSGDPEIDRIAREAAEHELSTRPRPNRTALISVAVALAATAAALVTEFTAGGIDLLTPLLWLVVSVLALSLAVLLPISVAVRRRHMLLLNAPPTHEPG